MCFHKERKCWEIHKVKDSYSHVNFISKSEGLKKKNSAKAIDPLEYSLSQLLYCPVQKMKREKLSKASDTSERWPSNPKVVSE